MSRASGEGLSGAELDWLASQGELELLRAGDQVAGGHRSDGGMTVVISGALLVTSRRDRRPGEGSLLLAGAVYGGAGDRRRVAGSYRIRAVRASRLVHLSRGDLRALFGQRPELGMRLLAAQEEDWRDLFASHSEPVRIWGIYGPRPGAGATSAARTLAELAARAGLATVLVDFEATAPADPRTAGSSPPSPSHDPMLTDPYGCLETEPREARYDVVKAPLLAGGARTSFQELDVLRKGLRGVYDLVLLDLARSVNRARVEGLDRVDRFVVIVRADAQGLYEWAEARRFFSKNGIEEARLDLMVNRKEQAGGATQEDLRTAACFPGTTVIPHQGNTHGTAERDAAQGFVEAAGRILSRGLGDREVGETLRSRVPSPPKAVVPRRPDSTPGQRKDRAKRRSGRPPVRPRAPEQGSR